MNWIKYSEKLPEHKQVCWIFTTRFDPNGEVLQAIFIKSNTALPYFDAYGSPYSEIIGCNKAKYWMPFYAPEPTKEMKDELENISTRIPK